MVFFFREVPRSLENAYVDVRGSHEPLKWKAGFRMFLFFLAQWSFFFFNFLFYLLRFSKVSLTQKEYLGEKKEEYLMFELLQALVLCIITLFLRLWK